MKKYIIMIALVFSGIHASEILLDDTTAQAHIIEVAKKHLPEKHSMVNIVKDHSNVVTIGLEDGYLNSAQRLAIPLQEPVIAGYNTTVIVDRIGDTFYVNGRITKQDKSYDKKFNLKYKAGVVSPTYTKSYMPLLVNTFIGTLAIGMMTYAICKTHKIPMQPTVDKVMAPFLRALIHGVYI